MIPRRKSSEPWVSRTRRITRKSRPRQFEINYSYGEVVAAADQIQLYKLICRRWPQHGFTACFLRSPWSASTGSGMHTNVSISKEGKNLFWDPKGEDKLSKMGWNSWTASHPRKRHLPVVQFQRERLSPA